jgi:hypothetical protein
MKNFYCIRTLLIIVLLIPAFAKAQEQSPVQKSDQKSETKELPFYIGLSGSVNSSWIIYQQIYSEPFLDYKLTIRPGVNAQFGYNFAHNWGVRAEIGYAMLGQKYDGTQYSSPATRDIKYSYLQIPLMLKYRTRGEKVKFFAQAGLQFGFLLSATQKYLRNGEAVPDFYSERNQRLIPVGDDNITDRYTKVNLEFRFDLGVDVKLTNRLFINAGLSNMVTLSQVVAKSWRLLDYNGEYHISHNFYSGLNVGINYLF